MRAEKGQALAAHAVLTGLCAVELNFVQKTSAMYGAVGNRVASMPPCEFARWLLQLQKPNL